MCAVQSERNGRYSAVGANSKVAPATLVTPNHLDVLLEVRRAIVSRDTGHATRTEELSIGLESPARGGIQDPLQRLVQSQQGGGLSYCPKIVLEYHRLAFQSGVLSGPAA